MSPHKIQKFSGSRLATIDISEVGKSKHYVTGMIELDVSESRRKIKQYIKETGNKISFTAWLISTIAITLKKYPSTSSYLKGKNKLIIFDRINVSVVVEKELNGEKIPIPLIIDRANGRSIESITDQIADAKNTSLSEKDIVLQKKAGRMERMYYVLPGFLRRLVWKYFLRHPKQAFERMGNVAFTSIGMMGKINGWFIPTSVHPICFGIGSVVKKPVVIQNEIKIREILFMTILLDHDVVDGANMARFVNELSKNIEGGLNLE
jgi:pyruvate/2-oxoglutarate dehydrogenase complex dihydrolipoamide acyltransferase (E2) component